MKRFLAFALIALVPLLIGCRLVENDDSGADVTLATAATSFSLTPTVVLPKGATSGSLRAAIAPSAVTMTAGGTTFTYASHTTDSTTGNVTILFGSQTLSIVPTANLDGVVSLGNATLSVSIPVSVTVTTNGPVANSVTITITPNTAGTGFEVTVTTANTTINSTPTTATPVAVTTTATPASFAAALVFVSANYGAATLTDDVSTTVTVTTLVPSFVVNFNNTFTDPAVGSYTLTAKNVATGNSFTMTVGNGFTIATGSKTITFNVSTMSNPVKSLQNGSTYQVTFVGTISNATSGASTFNVTRYFKVTL